MLLRFVVHAKVTEAPWLALADFDADGLQDLYITQYQAQDLLLRSLGGFVFEDVTITAGMGDNGPGTGASWGDYDGDGWLDLYVNNYSAPPDVGRLNRLYRNNGDGTFDEVSRMQGVGSPGLSFQSVWSLRKQPKLREFKI